jgi:hypothetical protein
MLGNDNLDRMRVLQVIHESLPMVGQLVLLVRMGNPRCKVRRSDGVYLLKAWRRWS